MFGINLREYNVDYNKLSSFVPWFALVDEGVIQNEDTSLQQTIIFRGRDTDSATDEELMVLIARVNNRLIRFGEGWCLYFEARRHRSSSYKDRSFKDSVCQFMDIERKNHFNQGHYYVTDYYVTLQWLPPSKEKNMFKNFFNYSNMDKAERDIEKEFQDNLKSFKKYVESFVDGFGSIVFECRPLTSEETLTYLHSIVSLDSQQVKTPFEPVALADCLCDTSFYGGDEPTLGNTFKSKHIGCIAITSFPEHSYPCMLDEFNRLDVEFRWVTRFIPKDKVDAQSFAKGKKREWLANKTDLMTMIKETITRSESAMVDTYALERFHDADNVISELADGYISLGFFTSIIEVRNENEELLEQDIRKLVKSYENRGFVVRRESMNAVQAFLGAIPGNAYADPRRRMISSLNLCHVLPLSSVWSGNEYCLHLSKYFSDRIPALAQVETAGNTPFWLNLYIGDVGHTIIVGPTGSGKSVFLNFLESQIRSIPDSRIYVFDKGGSSRVFAAAVNGEFYDLGLETDSDTQSFQPLRYIDDDNEKVWASEWLQELFTQEGIQISPDNKKAIWNALSSLAASPPEFRTLSGFMMHLQDLELRNAIEPFVIANEGVTEDGPYGRLFDSDKDTLRISDYQSFEMGELMNKKNAVMPVLLYLFHVIEKNCHGEPTFIVLDECWTFLDNPIFASKIREWLKTMRKNNVAIIFATQNLDDIRKCSISGAIIESCMTRFFLPNEQALNEGNEEVYGYFNLNKQERRLIASAQKKHDYYYKSSEGSRLFSLALSPYSLSFLAASSKEDQAEAQYLLKEYPKPDFMLHWLSYKKLDDVIPYYKDLMKKEKARI